MLQDAATFATAAGDASRLSTVQARHGGRTYFVGTARDARTVPAAVGVLDLGRKAQRLLHGQVQQEVVLLVLRDEHRLGALLAREQLARVPDVRRAEQALE